MKQRDLYRHNDEQKKKQRRMLRNNTTHSEYVLWQELRKQKLGYKFRRQVSIGAFIVDFYCHELRLIIEVDGWVHEEEYQKEYDERRQFWLEKRGYMIIRFLNDEVLFERDSVIEKIKQKCDKRSAR
jgi:very-short-patch-repair endonuclease